MFRLIKYLLISFIEYSGFGNRDRSCLKGDDARPNFRDPKVNK
jgi:hypothetical protein